MKLPKAEPATPDEAARRRAPGNTVIFTIDAQRQALYSLRRPPAVHNDRLRLCALDMRVVLALVGGLDCSARSWIRSRSRRSPMRTRSSADATPRLAPGA